jgi:hypothetical protein
VPLRVIHPGEIVRLQHLQPQQLFLRVSLRHPEQRLIGGVAEFAAYLRFVSPEIYDSIIRVNAESVIGVVCACSLDKLQVLNQPSEWNRFSSDARHRLAMATPHRESVHLVVIRI